MSRGEHVIGNSKRNLVLKTAGTIKVLVGDKYYSLNFSEEDSSSKNDNDVVDNDEDIVEEEISSSDEIIIIDNIDGYEYPGDGKVIMTLDGKIYYTSNNSYNEYLNNIEIPNTFHNTINFNNSQPFKVINNSLITNLNANYLNGYSADDFILDSRTLKFNNVIVDSIESSDGVFKYKDGIWSLKEFIPDTHFLNNKVHIGKGINIKSFKELEYSKGLPYENTLLNDLLKVVDVMDETPYYYVTNLLNTDIDLSYIETLSKSEQINELMGMDDVLFSVKESDLWNTEVLAYDEYVSLNSIKSNVVNIDNLRFHKSSFILYVDDTDGINIYDELKAEIKSYYKTDLSGNVYDLCYDGDSHIKYDSNIVNCIVTKIDKEKNTVCVTTDYETKMFKESKSEVDYILYNNNKYYYNSYDVDLCDVYDVFGDCAYSGNDIIGNLTGEVVNGIELSGYGLLINDNGYILNSNIYTTLIKDSEIIDSEIKTSRISNSKMFDSEITNCSISNCDISDSNCNNISITSSSIEDTDISSSNIFSSIIENPTINSANMSNSSISVSNITNSKISNCDIVKEVEYLNVGLGSEYNIDVTKSNDYSIYNNGSVILGNSSVNGIIINIYAINDVDIRVSGESVILSAGTYASYRNIPISDNEYKWIKIN